MKRISVIVLMLLYLVPVVGVTISAHYCGSVNTSVSYNPFDTSHKCACGAEKMADDCCTDENTVIKLDDDQHKAQQVAFKIFKGVDIHPVILREFSSAFQLSSSDQGRHNALHPPDEVRPALYILHRVLLI